VYFAPQHANKSQWCFAIVFEESESRNQELPITAANRMLNLFNRRCAGAALIPAGGRSGVAPPFFPRDVMSQWRVRTICGLLVAIHLAIGLLAASLVQVGGVTPANFFFAMVVGSQLCLLGMWAGLAWRRTLRRAFACAAGLTLGTVWVWELLLTATQTWHRERICEYAAWLCVTAVATAFAGTLALRWRWLELVRFPKTAERRQRDDLQFSLRQLMLLVSANGLTLGLGRALSEFFSQGANEHAVAAFYSVFIAVFSVIVLLGMLAPGRLGLNSLGLPLLVLGLTNVLNLLIHCRSREFVATALFAGGASCVVMATLLPVRLAGYRLIRRSQLAAAPLIRRRKIERQRVEDCGARIAEWLTRSAPLADISDDAPSNRL
jgi:hypothetical protein